MIKDDAGIMQTTDPVCGMQVDISLALWKTEVEAQTFYFCGAICKRTFDKNLDKLLDLERLKKKRQEDQIE